jgi:hypothetical protein
VPLRAPLAEPPRVWPGWRKPVLAPPGSRLVKPFSRPLHHDHYACGREHCLDTIQHLAKVRDMMQRRARDNRSDGPGLIALELRPPVPGTFRRLRIDADSVIASRTQHGNEAAKRPAPDLGHRSRRRGQLCADEWPDRGKPAIIMNHPPETTTSPRLPSRRVERAAVPSGPQIRPATHHLAGAAAASAAALILLSVSTMPRLTWRPLGTGSSVRRLITGHHTNWKGSASKVPARKGSRS